MQKVCVCFLLFRFFAWLLLRCLLVSFSLRRCGVVALLPWRHCCVSLSFSPCHYRCRCRCRCRCRTYKYHPCAQIIFFPLPSKLTPLAPACASRHAILLPLLLLPLLLLDRLSANASEAETEDCLTGLNVAPNPYHQSPGSAGGCCSIS